MSFDTAKINASGGTTTLNPQLADPSSISSVKPKVQAKAPALQTDSFENTGTAANLGKVTDNSSVRPQGKEKKPVNLADINSIDLSQRQEMDKTITAMVNFLKNQSSKEEIQGSKEWENIQKLIGNIASSNQLSSSFSESINKARNSNNEAEMGLLLNIALNKSTDLGKAALTTAGLEWKTAEGERIIEADNEKLKAIISRVQGDNPNELLNKVTSNQKEETTKALQKIGSWTAGVAMAGSLFGPIGMALGGTAGALIGTASSLGWENSLKALGIAAGATAATAAVIGTGGAAVPALALAGAATAGGVSSIGWDLLTGGEFALGEFAKDPSVQNQILKFTSDKMKGREFYEELAKSSGSNFAPVTSINNPGAANNSSSGNTINRTAGSPPPSSGKPLFTGSSIADVYGR